MIEAPGGSVSERRPGSVSERRQQRLQETKDRYDQLGKAIEEVAWLTDVEKNVMLYVSPGYEQIWGRTCKSLVQDPRDWAAAIHPDDRARVLEAALTRQSAGTYDEEYRIVRPDGSTRWIRERAFPVRDASGTVVRLAGAAQDITRQRELETQLNQAQKLESIGLLAGGIAHDFNNLLTVMGAGCDWLTEALGDNPELLEILGEVRDATARAGSLTRQLLAFARRDATEASIVTVASVVEDADRMLRRILGEDILLTVDNGAKATIEVDAAKIGQVLMNLAVNARDAMPKGGALRIATGLVNLEPFDQPPVVGMCAGEYVTITVSDTGTGIPEHLKARVFEPFFTTKAPGRGTGLGLSVVHGIVSQSRGFILLDSGIGVGTTFTVYFPRLHAKGVVKTPANAIAKTNGSETVLLVEDDDAIRRVAKRALQGAGYVVIEAGDGEAAMEIAARHSGDIHLLVTDVVMPGVDGPTLAHRLCEAREVRSILFTTGYGDEMIASYGFVGSQVALLRKPYDIVELRKMVRHALDGVLLAKAPGVCARARSVAPSCCGRCHQGPIAASS